MGDARMKLFAKRACLIAALLIPAPTVAQSGSAQTPENAQRFLTVNLPTKFIYYNPATMGSQEVFHQGPVTSARNVCSTDYQAYTTAQGTQSWNLDWTAVAEVEHKTGTEVVEIKERKRMNRIYNFNSPALAARAAYAMEFLRQHCDPSADTGF
jgi:hypothetical protein